jgi:hypothetical protein
MQKMHPYPKIAGSWDGPKEKCEGPTTKKSNNVNGMNIKQ